MTLEAAVEPRASLLKSRVALQAAEVAKRHADLSHQLDEGEGGSLEKAFVIAYDAAEAQADASDRK